MMPNGILASEKFEEAGIWSQDFGAIVEAISEVLVLRTVRWRSIQSNGGEKFRKETFVQLLMQALKGAYPFLCFSDDGTFSAVEM